MQPSTAILLTLAAATGGLHTSVLEADGRTHVERYDAGIDAEMQAVLDKHNEYRKCQGVPPMTWNDEIAANAATWANKGKKAHSSKDSRKNVAGFSTLGENMALGADGADAVELWHSEIKKTDDGKVSSFSSDTERYTQVVWKSSTSLGCGSNGDLLFCQYGPGGNMPGAFEKNVLGGDLSCGEGGPGRKGRGKGKGKGKGPGKCGMGQWWLIPSGMNMTLDPALDADGGNCPNNGTCPMGECIGTSAQQPGGLGRQCLTGNKCEYGCKCCKSATQQSGKCWPASWAPMVNGRGGCPDL